MTRELKFRVWDEITKSYFIESHKVQMRVYSTKNVSTSRLGLVPLLEQVIEQFTGLVDKNGKEIYEGDIVICKARNDKEDKRRIGQNYISEVFWDVDGWFVHDSPLCDSPLGMFDNTPSRRPIASIEVIGNIHENGDLLK